MKPSLSIIIPAYNEAERLGQTLETIFLYLRKTDLKAEVIVVDDGSTDETTRVARQTADTFADIRTEVIRYEENRGKGFAVKTGLIESKGEIALFSDADLSTPIEELHKLIKPIEQGLYDVTFGSRALDRSLIETRQPWRREQSGKIFNFVVKTFTGLPFWDTQCGFKAFRMSKFRPLLNVMQVERFGFDVEFLYVADYRDLRLREIPVRWNHCDGTKVSIFRDSQKMFREINQIRQNAKRGFYDAEKINPAVCAVEALG